MTVNAKSFEVGSKVHFHLRPFNSEPLMEGFSLSGCIDLTAESLGIEYKLQGPLKCIKRPSILPNPGRRNELWRHTCFELFFGLQGEAAYWEVNLSPSGCWNIYHFDDYRTGMREDSAIGPPLCHINSDTDSLSLRCSLECSSIIDNPSPFEIGLSAVIEAIDGSTSYWAIEHQGTKPDFHDRRGFQIQMTANTRK